MFRGHYHFSVSAFTLFLSLLTASTLSGQVYEIDNEFFVSSCSGIMVDDGGVNGGHSPNTQQQVTICSGSIEPDETHIRLTFTNYNISGTIQIYNNDFVDPGSLVYEGDGNVDSPPVIEATASNPGGCLTVVFTPDGGTGSGWEAAIQCIQSCQTVRAVLDSSTPAIMPVDTGYIDICLGDAINLTGAGEYLENNFSYTQSDATSTFRWNMEDGTILEGPNIAHTYTRPGGYLVQLQVTDVAGCTSRNLINQRIRIAGVPRFPIQNDLPSAICANDTLQLTASTELDPNDSTSIFAFGEEQFFSQPALVADSFYLPDGFQVEYSSAIEFSSFPFGSTITSVNDILGFCVNMEHSYAGDLQIEMECPNGSIQVLHNYDEPGNSTFSQYFGEAIDFDDGPNPGVGYDYCWVPDATETIHEAIQNIPVPGNTTIPAGDYATDEPFSNLLGCPLNGEWRLRVIDNLSIDNGYIFSWSIELAAYLFPERESFQVQVVEGMWIEDDNMEFYSPDSISSIPQFAGESGYIYQVRDTFGCINDTTIVIDVLPYSSPDCYQCAEMLDSLEQTFNSCSSGDIQTSLASRTTLDTTIAWAAYPVEDFSFSTYPNPANAFRSVIDVNSMRPATLTDATSQILSVCVNIETRFTDEVTLFLEAPNGSRMLLVQNRGVTNNFTQTCFSPTASTSILSGTNPYTGTFEPEGDWTDLNGSNINGEWAIIAWDRAGLNSPGRFLNWSIEFTHQNPITYAWSPAAGLSCTNCPAPIISTATSQVYTVTATDAYGCSETGTVTVNLSGFAYDFTPTVADASCNGLSDGNISIAPNEATPVTFAWSNGPTTPTNPNLAPGNYTLTVTRNEGGCTNMYDFTIAEPAAIAISLVEVDSVSCFGASDGMIDIEVAGGTGNYTYTWDDPNLLQVLQDAVSLEAGTYTVTATDANNCQQQFSATVAEPAAMTVGFSPQDVSCRGQATGTALAEPMGGNGGYTFSWETGATTALAPDLAAGNFSVTVTDSKGCTAINTVTIDEPATAINLTFVQDQMGCAGAGQNTATLNALGGSAPYTFLWADGQVTATATNLPAGSNSVLVTDAAGCAETLNISLQELAPITFNLIDSRPTCNGSISGEMGFNQLAGGAPTPEDQYTYQWSDGQTSVVATNLQGGTSYSLTITDSQGCTGVASRLLIDPVPLSATTSGSATSCFGFADGSVSVSNILSPNVGPVTVLWDAAAGSSTSLMVNNLPAGTYSFTVTDAAGCTYTDAATVIQPTLLSTSLNPDDVTCFGDTDGSIITTTSGGTPSYTYNWSNGTTSSSTTQLSAGSYSLTVSDANGCQTVESVTIAQPAQVVASAVSQPVICSGDATGRVIITANGGRAPFTFSVDNSGYSRGAEFIGLTAGNYTAYVRDAGGCIGATQVNVPEGPVFEIDLGEDFTIEFGDSIRLNANYTGGVDSLSFFWEGSYDGTLLCRGDDEPREASTVVTCEAPNARPEYEIDYTLRIVDGNGCEAEDRVRVSVQKFRIVEVPTGFTPNDDGNNDLLLVHGRPGTKINHFRIFDRWGELIYEGTDFDVNDPTQGWDGRYKNELVNSGVYLWQLSVLYEDESVEILSGQTTLLR